MINLDKIAASFLKPASTWTPPAGPLTLIDEAGDVPPHAVRYYIPDDVWNAFTYEGVETQIEFLKQEGLFGFPNSGAPFTVRLGYPNLLNQIFEAHLEMREHAAPGSLLPDGSDKPNSDELSSYYDFFYAPQPDGTVKLRISQLMVCRWSVPPSATQAQMDHVRIGMMDPSQGYLPAHSTPVAVHRQWRVRNMFYTAVEPQQAERDNWRVGDLNIAAAAPLLLIILLHYRGITTTEIERDVNRRGHLHIAKRYPNYDNAEREITLYIPRRIYDGDGEATGATKRPHFRRTHQTNQPYGPRGAGLRKVIWISGIFVNYDFDNPDCDGTPIKLGANYRFKI